MRLYDGEDFELVFTLNEQQSGRLARDSDCPNSVTAIGRMTGDREYFIVDESGNSQRLEIKGYEH